MSTDQITIPAGSLVFHEEDNVDAVFLVKSGRVLVVKEYQGRFYPLKIASAQGFLAETTANSSTSQVGTTAITLEDSVLIPISKKDFESFIKTAPQWVGDLMKNFCERVAHAQELIAEHKIFDESLAKGFSFDSEKELFIRKLIKEHRS